MTTDRKPNPRAAPTQGAGFELRLGASALLALSYVSAFWAFGVTGGEPAAQSPDLASAVEPDTLPRLTVWYADLPPSERPPLQLPAGFELSRSRLGLAEAAPRAVRRAPARSLRVRTRSS